MFLSIYLVKVFFQAKRQLAKLPVFCLSGIQEQLQYRRRADRWAGNLDETILVYRIKVSE
jgi:hypothetical protein